MKYLFSLLVLFSTFSMFAQLPSYVPTNGLVGYWPFNGNAIDESGNGFNGIVSNVSLTTDRNNTSNSAYLWPSTNGTNSFIDVGNLHTLIPNSITISAWILADGGTINPRIISSGEVGFSTQSTINANRYYQAAWDRAGTGIWPSTFPVSSNVWHHLVFTANHINGQAKLYVDGVLTDSSCCGIPNPNYVMNNTWNIGRKSISAFDAWGGKLDDIGVWNRALTQQEITNLFTSSIQTPTCNITTTDSSLCLGESTTLTVPQSQSVIGQSCTGLNTNNFTSWTSLSPIDNYTNIINENNIFYLRSQSDVLQATNLNGPWTSMGFNSQVGNTCAGLMLGFDWSNRLQISTCHNNLYVKNGANWQSNGLGGFGCGGNFIHKLANNRIIVMKAGYLRDLYISDNNGTTWTNVTNVDNDYWSMVVANNGTIFSSGGSNTASMSGLIRSTNNGNSFSQINSQLGISYCSGLSKDCSGNIYAVADNKIFISIDNGSTWVQNCLIPTYFTTNPIYSNFVKASNGDYYLWSYSTAQLSGFFKSTNQGATWVQITDVPVAANTFFNTIKELNGNIIVATGGGVFAKSIISDATYSWSTGATTPSITVSPTTTTTYTCTSTVNGVSCTDAITVTVDSLNLALPATTNVCGTSATISATAGATSYVWNTNATTASITPTTSGLYSVTATKGACVKSATTQLNLLNPVVSSPDSILCVGESTTLTSNTTVSPSSICSSAALPTNLQTGLVGYWPFCGNANDASGNGNNGTVNGATLTTDRFGNANSAYSFDGNDWISATRAHQAVFTASVWVQSTNGNCNKPILDANNASWELYSDCANGQLSFIMWNGGTYTYHSTNVALGLNTWYHVVAVYSSSQVKVYVNGSLITTQVTTAVPAISGVLNMGASLSGTSQYFTGKLDDVGLWSRALTLAEIQQLYTQGETTYSWSPGNATTQSITVSPTTTTTYTCTTTVNGASCTDAIVVTVNQLPLVNAGTDQSVCLNQPVTLSGSGAVSYSWNNSVINNTPFSPNTTSTYTVIGTDVNGCVNKDSVIVTIKPLPVVSAGLDQSICIGNPAIFNATGNAFSYSWSNGVANQVPFFPTNTASYIVTGTGANGCVKTDTMTITVNPLPIVSAGSDTSICFGQSIVLSGSGANTYTWDNGVINNTSFTPSLTANYIVTGTNANACQGKDTVVVTIKSLPSINAGIDKIICAGDSVALTASGSPLISWNNGIFNSVYFYPTATTTYTVTGTGANGCINTDQAIVTVNALPPVNAGADTALCNGSYLTLSGSGAVSYIWSNSVSNAIPFIPSSTTTYSVTGTDANGCKNTDQIVVTVNILPPVNAGINDVICLGDSTQLTATGALTYVWNNGVVNATAFYPTSTLTYTVVGTDTNGCSNSDSVIVTVNPLPTVFAGNDTLLCDQSTYTLSGSGAITYTWNNGVTNGVPFTVNANTTYTVQGIDGNGCQNTDQVTLTTKPLPTVDAGSDKPVCFGDSLFFTATGSGVSYSWSNGLINGNYFTPTTTMTLTVTATAANGCVQTDQVIAIVNPLPTVDAGPDRIICKGQAIVLNAVSNGSIVWGGGVVNNLPFNPPTTATYGVTATSAAGCVNTDDVVVEVGEYPIANFYTETPTQYAPNSMFDFVNISTGGSAYEWDFGDLIGASTMEDPSYMYQPLVTATYIVSLIVTSPLGCKDSISSVVQVINDSPGVDVIIPTGFSPNNDSDNDNWTIYGIENYPNSNILVFNRWGLKVFEGTELKATWDGSFGGELLPTADYYYIIELSDGRKFNGVVTLKQ